MKKLFLIVLILFFAATAVSAERKPFLVGGLSIGTPGGINMTAGYYGTIFGARGTLGIFNIIDALDKEEDDLNHENDEELFIFGLQLNLDILVLSFDSFFLTIGPVGGIYYEDEEGESSHFMAYAGGAVGINIVGFYMEVGYAYVTNEAAAFFELKNRHTPLVQIGYMLRIN